MEKMYGIIYGIENCPDFHITGPYDTVQEARESYDEENRIYCDGWLGGASIIEVDIVRRGALFSGSAEFLDPGKTIEVICQDEEV